MWAPAITLLLLLAQQPAGADSTAGRQETVVVGGHEFPDLAAGLNSAATRQIAAPCQLVEERAIQYLEGHGFYANGTVGRKIASDDIIVTLGPRKGASTPSAKPLSLNRFTIHKYTAPKHLSPLKTYDFRLEGQLKLTETAEASCNATLRFEISGYEWVWSLAVIDDGYRSKFASNGELERLYIDAIGGLFAKATH